jgi:hypothetical protein
MNRVNSQKTAHGVEKTSPPARCEFFNPSGPEGEAR